jgi:cell wall-associated NlpC family hydrolase
MLLIVAGTPVSAAAAAGGVSVGGTPANGASRGGATPAATAPAVKRHTAPVTSHSASLLYRGPVYQKTATGEIVPYVTPQASGELKATTGGSAAEVLAGVKPELLVPGHTARVVSGLAAAPMSAPPTVQEIVWAGNQIVGLPYIFGGGHASFSSPGYDCSGTVSFALHGASLLSTPEDSSEFMAWGSHGVGTWVTVFSNPGHAYMTVAGLRLDTSAADDPTNQQGPRWRPLRPANEGYTVRHPTSL